MCCWANCFSCMCSLSSCCSENVGCATCNTALCSSCMTGDCFYSGAFTPVENPTSGNDIAFCTTPPDAPCLGTPCFIDGIPANDQSILSATCNASFCPCNCYYVNGPCSPATCGTTDQPPVAGPRSSGSGGGQPQGGGSGGGSAPSAKGQPRCTKNCTLTKLQQAVSKLGSSMASLMSGGQKVSQASVIPGQKATGLFSTMTPNTFGLIVLIFGGLLLWMAFGHRNVGD